MFNYFNIDNGFLLEKFETDKYVYHVTIEKNIKKLDFNFETRPGSKINILGNNNLSKGTNYVFLEIEYEDKLYTYTFIVEKENATAVFEENQDSYKLENNIPKPDYKIPLIIGYIIVILIIIKIIFIHKKKM